MVKSKKNADSRRDAFLDIAEELFADLGYENTSIERIISRLGVSKGAFYHYFRSKSDLLDSTLDRILSRTETPLVEILESQAPAIEKLKQFLRSLEKGLSANRKLSIQIGEFLLNEANAVLLNRHRRVASNRFVPLLTKIIEQGVIEGVFRLETPHRVARIVWVMGESMDEAGARALIEIAETPAELSEISNLYNAYSLAIERVLGAKEGSLRIVDAKMLEPWIETISSNKAKNNSISDDAQIAASLY